MNFAFSTGSAAIGLPNDGAWGAAYGSMLGRNGYIIAGITDINGDPTKPFDALGNILDDREFFSSVEIGWTTSQKQIMLDNAHVTVWHKSSQDSTQTDSGYGIAFSLSRYFNENFMPFVRGGYAKDAGTLLQKSLSLGMGY